MPAISADKLVRTIALIGNPNTGKSTLFSALAGVRQRVGNYPGVTVEKKIGHTHFPSGQVALIDLPGTYSIAPRSLDEMVAVDVLLGKQADVPKIDCILSIVDASNLERNLYLLSQVLELGVPVVVALTMTDVAAERNVQVDIAQLSQRLGVPVVPVQAHRGQGLAELKSAIERAAAAPPPVLKLNFPAAFTAEVDALHQQLAAGNEPPTRYLAERLVLDVGGYVEQRLAGNAHPELVPLVAQARARLQAEGVAIPMVEAITRYGWVAQIIAGVVQRPIQRVVTASDRLDGILTHRVWGLLLFAAAMLLIFSSVFTFAGPLMTAVDGAVGSVQDWVSERMTDGALKSLVVDGMLGGVGSVVIFLPQILILFFFIGLLEDCGYMARAAYLMDRVMSRFGLSGKSFIPLLSSFACAVPGIMATRVIENHRDRLTTILIAPLMSCSARLPVYFVLTAAFVPAVPLFGWLPLQGVTLFCMYLVGLVAAAAVAWLLKRTLLKGPTPPFVMELPSYKWPSPKLVLLRMWERGWAFIERAGTLILAVSIVVWALGYFPHDQAAVEGPFLAERERLEAAIETADSDADRELLEGRLTEIDNQIDAEYLRQSWLGRAGRVIEPVVRPLGWDWRIGAAAIASFPAREVVMGVLGVIYNLGAELDVGESADQTRLASRLQAATHDDTGKPVYNLPVALGIMVFFALCAQCAATLAVIKRETNSWFWPAFTFGYMTALAYVGALVTYQVGMWLAG